ncbi:G patch domain-containing protein 3 [Nymphon striatum]|nr:G patch domain-containing protein 3 [Nymphon striatum]
MYFSVNNIPKSYHSADLRNFFSQIVESGVFECFHFRHRPEVQVCKDSQESPQVEINDSNVVRKDTNQDESNTTCCVIKVHNDYAKQFFKMYNKKHWIDKNLEMMTKKCFISRIKVEDVKEGSINRYKTRKQLREIETNRNVFTSKDLNDLIELHPPALMPNGNVGTPTAYFLKMINTCRLPPIIISKLGLVFPRTKSNKIYGCVPFDYGMSVVKISKRYQNYVVRTGNGQILSKKFVHKKPRTEETIEEDESAKEESPKSDEDDDTCEEWERHESLHNDVTSQERNKERLFEEEIELKWEKGGSGLVFYTDAQYWDEKEGDFDEKTTDDWDVDMSVYYDPDGGDKDSRDLVQMRRETKFRNGELILDDRIGKFENHTRGFGRRLMEKQGWQDGQGLGSSTKGIADALSNDGQHPKDKKGLGFHGEKLVRFGTKRKPYDLDKVTISTAFDDQIELDKPEPLYRSYPPTANKCRGIPIKFTKQCSDS